MIRWFRTLLYDSRAATFSSAFGLEDSVARLKSASARFPFSAGLTPMAVGRVSATGVSLCRVIPFVGNSFKPYFVGRFRVVEGGVVLEGRFAISRGAQILVTIWFGFVALWTLAVTVVLLTGHRDVWFAPLFGLGMFGFGILLVWFGKWLSRNDAAWLSERIAGALGGNPGRSTPAPIE